MLDACFVCCLSMMVIICWMLDLDVPTNGAIKISITIPFHSEPSSLAAFESYTQHYNLSYMNIYFNVFQESVSYFQLLLYVQEQMVFSVGDLSWFFGFELQERELFKFKLNGEIYFFIFVGQEIFYF